MRLTIVAAVVLAVASGVAGIPVPAGGGIVVGPWNAAPVLHAITSAKVVDSFLLAGLGMVDSDAITNVGGYRVLTAAGALDSFLVAALARTIQQASRDTCGLPTECVFEPGYAFRVHDASPPLDILISSDCEAWVFQRAMEPIAGYSPWARCVRDSLHALVARAFPDSAGSR